jgi:hypothetical protein
VLKPGENFKGIGTRLASNIAEDLDRDQIGVRCRANQIASDFVVDCDSGDSSAVAASADATRNGRSRAQHLHRAVRTIAEGREAGFFDQAVREHRMCRIDACI